MRLQDLEAPPGTIFTRDQVQKLLSKGHILLETMQKKKDGTVIPVEISSRTTEYFGMPAIISIARDITERKR